VVTGLGFCVVAALLGQDSQLVVTDAQAGFVA